MEKQAVKALREEVKDMVAPLLAKHGVTLERNSASYDQYGATITLHFVSANGGPTKAQDEFTKYAKLFGLDPTWLGKTFQSHDHAFTVSGLNGGRPRYPVDAVRDDGKTFKFTTEMIVRILGKPQA
jgi:hypothetical protein